VYIFPAGAGTRNFFQKNFSKKKNWSAGKSRNFFSKKVSIFGVLHQAQKICVFLKPNMFWKWSNMAHDKNYFPEKKPF